MDGRRREIQQPALSESLTIRRTKNKHPCCHLSLWLVAKLKENRSYLIPAGMWADDKMIGRYDVSAKVSLYFQFICYNPAKIKIPEVSDKSCIFFSMVAKMYWIIPMSDSNVRWNNNFVILSVKRLPRLSWMSDTTRWMTHCHFVPLNKSDAKVFKLRVLPCWAGDAIWSLPCGAQEAELSSSHPHTCLPNQSTAQLSIITVS